MDRPVAIIGAGLAGLSCAKHLHAAGIPLRVLEADDGVGGRVRTDRVDGFLLDRGFQVLQTAYPEAKAILDYDQLQLHSFDPGACIRTEGGWAWMVDPWRRPKQTLGTIWNEVGTIADRFRLARMRWSLTSNAGDRQKDCSTLDYLRNEVGFSEDFIERFLRPWISGMFFDEELETSAAFFRFVFRMLATGDAALPSSGMGAIPSQLADSLPSGSVSLSTPVVSADANSVTIDGGEQLEATAVVVATGSVQAELLSDGLLKSTHYGSTSCIYFAAKEAPTIGKTLALNGQLGGPISNVSVPSAVAPSYAPEGSTLVCVSIRTSQANDANLEHKVEQQLKDWFGLHVDQWRRLRRYDILHAIPRQAPGTYPLQTDCELPDGRFVCGDFRSSASIQGAFESGRRTAEAVLEKHA